MQAFETPCIALWATNLAEPLEDIDHWAEKVGEVMTEVAGGGAHLLVLPEYLSAQWLTFAPRELPLTEEVAWMAKQSAAALDRLWTLVERHSMTVVAGTMPVEAAGRFADGPAHVNRAHVLFPGGGAIVQDKLCLTPSEREPRGWNLNVGTEVACFELGGMKMAVLVCLDIELPALAARLAGLDLDLVIVPSMTERLAGYHRVFGCAKARAVELQCAVAAVGCVGTVPLPEPRCNVSGAAVFLPCEEEFDHHGCLRSLPPVGEASGPGPLLVVREVPLGKVREIRRTRAEVWPGAWSADHVEIPQTR